MKKLGSYKELVIGGIYNVIYVGDNKAYAKINGKQTFIVTATSPKLKARVLFDQFGSAFTDDLRSNEITYAMPEMAFAEYELYEAEDRSEWFIKSQYMSLQDAFKEGLVTNDEIKQRACFRWIVSVDGKGYYISYPVEGKSKSNPYLQSVFVTWSSYAEMEADFAKLGITVR